MTDTQTTAPAAHACNDLSACTLPAKKRAAKYAPFQAWTSPTVNFDSKAATR